MAVPSFGAATTMPSQANDEPAAAGGGKNMVHNKQGIDMLHGRIWTKVLRFALPVAATGILEQLFNASGIMIVGNFSQSDGTAAVAAVGSNAPVTGLILNLFIGIALGANVVIANAIGRGSREAVRNAVHTSIVTALIGGVIVAIIGELLAGPLLGMLNVTADVFPWRSHTCASTSSACPSSCYTISKRPSSAASATPRLRSPYSPSPACST